ncbi:cytochrome c oxidase subunit II [Alphaproteobacteria bacterium]|nr:cytochrome c oxidase subunit II [Alphaproteobacteria bacterium]
MRSGKILAAATTFITGHASASSFAAEPLPWQYKFQPAVTPVMGRIDEVHQLLLVIISLIIVFVLGLLIYTMVKFSARNNPVPSRTTHNTMIEMLWTVVPVIILVIIAVPSFKLLYYADVVPKADMTIKATGSQWYWSYQYPDHGKFSFQSNLIPDNELKKGQKRLLDTDTSVVVPVNAIVQVLVTADDVLHAWAIPAFGVKIDAVPGRLNETWFKATKEGTYYGQCSELCGIKHGFMPIRVDVVSKSNFDVWVATQRKAALLDVAPGEKRKFAALKRTTR